MQRTCPKCGFLNDAAAASSTASCPQCGVIYAKAAIAAARERQAATTRSRIEQSAAQPKRNAPSFVESIAWIITLIGAGVGIVQLGFTVANAESAPQQAAGAAIAVACAVIPYCLARAIQLASRR